MRFISETSRVTPQCFCLSDMSWSLSNCSKGLKKIWTWEKLGANVLNFVPVQVRKSSLSTRNSDQIRNTSSRIWHLPWKQENVKAKLVHRSSTEIAHLSIINLNVIHSGISSYSERVLGTAKWNTIKGTLREVSREEISTRFARARPLNPWEKWGTTRSLLIMRSTYYKGNAFKWSGN